MLGWGIPLLIKGLESQISRIREILTANSMRAQVLTTLHRDYNPKKNSKIIPKKPMKNFKSSTQKIKQK